MSLIILSSIKFFSSSLFWIKVVCKVKELIFLPLLCQYFKDHFFFCDGRKDDVKIIQCDVIYFHFL